MRKPILLLLSLFFLTACSGMLYYPSKQLYFSPAQFGTTPKEVNFQSASGTHLFGWYFQNDKKVAPKAILVFYHGNAENLSSHYRSLLWILSESYDFFIFDYAGYGRSEGKASPEETILDGEAALRLISKANPNTPLVVFAQSLGTAIAMRNVIDLKKELPQIRLVVIDSGFLSYKKVGRKVLAHAWITWPFQWIADLLLSDHYAPGDEVNKISSIPMVIVHGTADKTVDFSLGEEVFEKAGAPKEFWPVQDGGHIGAFVSKNNKYREDLLAKMKSLGI